MKKMIEYTSITILFIISLIYTDKITTIVKNKDPIMKDIVNIRGEYKIESVNAEIYNDNITPGINGCDIDLDKSYENMKKINSFNDKLLKYKDLIPEISINYIFDKYISNGNHKERNVALVVYIESSIEEINKYQNNKLNIFLNSKLLNNGKIEISQNKKVYNGGNNLNYDDVTIEWMNDVILSNYNAPKYCLNPNRNDDNLNICARNKMHTINPKLIVNKTNTYEIKTLINNGSIIYFNENNIDKINEISDYIIKKGYNIVYLDELLSENKCIK